ncbi:MAG TPA: hypothetical protein VI729_00670 [Anaerolineales bacterium]|nr:hypothetical protein [Anaerolineales bacterium]
MENSVHGLDDAIRKLFDLQRKAAELHGEHSIPISDLFPDPFMVANTDFAKIQDMLDASGFPASTSEEFSAIPDDQWDAFVASRTKFPSWQAMLDAGTAEWVSLKLGL